MNRPGCPLLSCCAAFIAGAGPARADGDPRPTSPAPSAELPGETIQIEGQAPVYGARDRDRRLGEAPFVTVLHPDDHPATASVADALATAAGAHRRSLGGLGAFESVSVRGASPGHTAVLIDGVPLARIAAVTADLGRFALDAFGEVDLYRGAVPIELGGAGVGGAVNLKTRLGPGEHDERVRASIGGGSHGARHLRGWYGDAFGRWRTAATLGYQGATGDYAHFSDNGTPLDPDDDRTLIRRNNAFDQVDGAARAGLADGTGTAGVRVGWKHQGLPGSIAQPATAAELSTLDVLCDGHRDLVVGDAVARQLGYALVEWQTLGDPTGELGLGAQDRGYFTISGGASSAWSLPVGVHRAAGGVELRGDRFADADRAGGGRPDLVGTRATAAIAASAELVLATTAGPDPVPAIVVTPAARLDLVRTAPTPMTEGPDAFIDPPSRDDVVASPRLSARALVDRDVALKGSAGWYVRLPTLVELFGDRGTILGSPDLAPERGPSADLGVVWAPRGAIGIADRILVEAAAFATRARDTIALVSSAGFVARAENVGDTRSYGAELVGSVRLAETVALTASYTGLRAYQRAIDPNLDGKTLPRTPAHRLYARADAQRRIAARAVGGWLDAAAQSTSYLDAANLQRVPGRVLVGAGARVEVAARIAVTAAVENLADVRVVELPGERPGDPATRTPLSDLAGFPLPGRSFYLSLEWTR